MVYALLAPVGLLALVAAPALADHLSGDWEYALRVHEVDALSVVINDGSNCIGIRTDENASITDGLATAVWESLAPLELELGFYQFGSGRLEHTTHGGPGLALGIPPFELSNQSRLTVVFVGTPRDGVRFEEDVQVHLQMTVSGHVEASPTSCVVGGG